MTGKFWDMYKGSSSYDSFDETDTEMLVSEVVFHKMTLVQ